MSVLALCAESSTAYGQDSLTGATIFYACADCHGENGEGNEARHAPALAGQPAWYVTAQLESFRRGWRGGPDDDFVSQQMALFAEALPSNEDVETIAHFVEALPKTQQKSTPTTASADTELFRSCAVCHGVVGEGNETLSSPPLAGRETWYLRRQLRAFREGRRGNMPGDLAGQQMRAAMSNTSEADLETLIAFIGTLPIPE